MATSTTQPATCVLRTLGPGPSIDEAVAVFSRQPDAAILESAAGRTPHGRYSMLACDPVTTLRLSGETKDPLGEVQAACDRLPAMTLPAGVPFAGGWIGYFAYEVGLALEHLPLALPPAVGLPSVRLGLYDTAAVYDHDQRLWSLVAVEWPSSLYPRRPNAHDRLEKLESLLAGWHGSAVGGPVELGDTAGSPRVRLRRTHATPGALTPRPDWTPHEYFQRVAAIQDYIAAGDVYEVNLAQHFVAEINADAPELYSALRRANPADHAAFLAGEDGYVLSSSPELFLELRDGRVRTRPIKGTRPRTGDPVLDPIRRRELASSLKDEAELNMIIDLMRNDLGRVCRFGSVQVSSPGEIEAHPTVFHRVATVSGMLRPDCDAFDLLRAAFPAGSVTGAPKIRAMEIINEVEPVQRGVYCGAIGYVGLDGSMALNVAIRTMVLDRGRAHVYAGGAIVADSQPEDEYEETLAKAEGMFRALRSVARPESSSVAGATTGEGNGELRMENGE